MSSTNSGMKKSEVTQAAILSEAIRVAEQEGIAAISFGKLAERVHMSKSGIFTRTGNLKELQAAVLQELVRRFFGRLEASDYFASAKQHRLDALFAAWIGLARDAERSLSFFTVLHRCDSCLRSDHLKCIATEGIRRWRAVLTEACTSTLDCGREGMDGRANQLAFEINSVMVRLLSEIRFTGEDYACCKARTAYRRILASFQLETAVKTFEEQVG